MTESLSTPPAVETGAAPAPTTTWSRRPFASARYYVGLALLLSSAVGMPVLARLAGAHFRPRPVPLKAPLTRLRLAALEPEYRAHQIQAPPLTDENVQFLGTEEYLQVRLVDTRRAPSDPARVVNLFITYYTGKPDMVPHVPDECYLAGGYDPVGKPETIPVTVTGVGAPDDQIHVRVVQFQARSGRDKPTVLYFFHCNGQYLSTRDEVRFALANPFARHPYAYYAKIEMTFCSEGGTTPAGRSEALQACAPLLQKLMPVLLADHLAWDRVVSGELESEGK